MAVRPGDEYVPRPPVFHRGPPGPAQVELLEATPSFGTTTPTEPTAAAIPILDVDVTKAVSNVCGEIKDTGAATLEGLGCELASQVAEHIPIAASQLGALLLGEDLTQPKTQGVQGP